MEKAKEMAKAKARAKEKAKETAKAKERTAAEEEASAPWRRGKSEGAAQAPGEEAWAGRQPPAVWRRDSPQRCEK